MDENFIMETPAKCSKCKWEWITTSKAWLVSCPGCGNKVKVKA
jgi:DNA-directed RNA polymerase subunit RPC12/RpoP